MSLSLTHSHTHTHTHTIAHAAPSLPRPFSAELIAGPGLDSTTAAPGRPTLQSCTQRVPPISTRWDSPHPGTPAPGSTAPSLPESRLFIMPAGAGPGFRCSGHGMGPWGPGGGLCPRQSLAGHSQTVLGARRARIPGWGSVGLHPELGVNKSAGPCAGIGSRLCPPGGDNPGSRDRLPRGCPNILAEGDFLQHPEKTAGGSQSCGMAVPVSHFPLAPVLAQAMSDAGGILNKNLK